MLTIRTISEYSNKSARYVIVWDCNEDGTMGHCCVRVWDFNEDGTMAYHGVGGGPMSPKKAQELDRELTESGFSCYQRVVHLQS